MITTREDLSALLEKGELIGVLGIDGYGRGYILTKGEGEYVLHFDLSVSPKCQAEFYDIGAEIDILEDLYPE